LRKYWESSFCKLEWENFIQNFKEWKIFYATKCATKTSPFKKYTNQIGTFMIMSWISNNHPRCLTISMQISPKKNIFHFVHIVTPRNKESFCKMFVYISAYLINLLRLQFFLATYVDDEEKRKRKRKIMEWKKVIIKLVKIFFEWISLSHYANELRKLFYAFFVSFFIESEYFIKSAICL